jgi:hypothetical protein
VAVEEPAQGRLVALADLAQEPADGLVDQVVAVAEQALGEAQGLGGLAVANQGEGGEDRDAAVPDALRDDEAVEQGAVAAADAVGEQVGSRAVHQIPVVDPIAVVEVEAREPLALAGVGALEAEAEDRQGDEAVLVDLTRDQALEVGEGGVAMAPRDLPLLGNPDAEQDVALPVAAGCDPEVWSGVQRTLGVGERREVGLDLRRGGQTS